MKRKVAAMKPSTGTREQRIASMIIAGGMTNDQVWAAFEATNPEIIREDDPRRTSKTISVAYDHEERQKLGRAIRSVRGLAQKAAGEQQDLLDILGTGHTCPANMVPFENVKRWTSGDPVMDHIYGQTNYVWIIPTELLGKENPKTGKLWEYGDEIPKKYWAYLDPMTGLPGERKLDQVHDIVCYGDKTGHIEDGLPISFVDAWGGAQGVGKSRLAIELEKSVCRMHPGRAVVHNFGESNRQQLRSWIGPKAPDNLHIGERKSLAHIVADIYALKPILYVQDSLQTIIETESTRGLKEVLATFKQIATEESAGKCHIICISHLNKKGELKGTSDIGHIVDAVFALNKSDTRKGVISFASQKNRGGEVPRSAQYQHMSDKIVCLGSGSTSKPVINLEQVTGLKGVSDPVQT